MVVGRQMLGFRLEAELYFDWVWRGKALRVFFGIIALSAISGSQSLDWNL